MHVKSLGAAAGLANARTPGPQNLLMPYPWDSQDEQIPLSGTVALIREG